MTPEGDESGRFTALLGSSGIGVMLPLFQVVKVSCKKDPYDLSKSRVLNNLLANNNLFPHGHRFVLRMWTGVIVLEGNKPTTYKRPYLIDPVTLHVITVQNKAWNDSAGMLMHIQLQLKPYKLQYFPDLPCLLVVDGCGCHKKAEVVAAFADAGWLLKYFPPNMTGELQPMDLVVNAVCKKALRSLRIEKVLDYMRGFKIAFMAAELGRHPLPKFSPPVPKMADGVKAMLGLMSTTFATDKFKASLTSIFVKVGLCPHTHGANGNPLFVKYQSDSRLGKMSKPLQAAVRRNEAAQAAAIPTTVDSSDDDDEENDDEDDILAEWDGELEVEAEHDRDFYSIAGLLMTMEVRDEDRADDFE